mmetsp:Transcript_32363/g.76775  ORF Transcript_32363/g.76775 Transcript_32363/m.76775 type:complete len:95 (+) Transcript_32363:235-519(+)
MQEMKAATPQFKPFKNRMLVQTGSVPRMSIAVRDTASGSGSTQGRAETATSAADTGRDQFRSLQVHGVWCAGGSMGSMPGLQVGLQLDQNSFFW